MQQLDWIFVGIAGKMFIEGQMEQSCIWQFCILRSQTFWLPFVKKGFRIKCASSYLRNDIPHNYLTFHILKGTRLQADRNFSHPRSAWPYYFLTMNCNQVKDVSWLFMGQAITMTLPSNRFPVKPISLGLYRSILIHSICIGVASPWLVSSRCRQNGSQLI